MLAVNMCISYFFQYDLAVEMTISNKPSSRTNFDLVGNYSWQILMTASHNQKRGNVYRVPYYQFIDFILKPCELVPNFTELFHI